MLSAERLADPGRVRRKIDQPPFRLRVSNKFFASVLSAVTHTMEIKIRKLHIPSVLAAIIFFSGLVSLTWEKYTSYDDSSIGTSALFVIAPIFLISELIFLPPYIIWILFIGLFIYIDFLICRNPKRKSRH